MLWGQQLIAHTDHKNIVCGQLSNDKIIRWRLLLEEYSPTFIHVRGVDNVVADALSRLDKQEEITTDEQAHVMCYALCNLTRDESVYMPKAHDQQATARCYMNKKDIERT